MNTSLNNVWRAIIFIFVLSSCTQIHNLQKDFSNKREKKAALKTLEEVLSLVARNYFEEKGLCELVDGAVHNAFKTLQVSEETYGPNSIEQYSKNKEENSRPDERKNACLYRLATTLTTIEGQRPHAHFNTIFEAALNGILSTLDGHSAPTSPISERIWI